MWPINITKKAHTHTQVLELICQICLMYQIIINPKIQRRCEQKATKKITYINDDRITDDINHKMPNKLEEIPKNCYYSYLYLS